MVSGATSSAPARAALRSPPDQPAAVVNSYPLPVTVPRFNAPPSSIGRKIQRRLVDLLDAGTIHPVVGRTVSFADLPQALEDMESRATLGRIVVTR